MAGKKKKQKKQKPPMKDKEKVKSKRKKGVRKKFFEAAIPLTTTKVHLYGYSPEELEGKTVKLDLTKNLRGKNLELKAKLKLKSGKLTGELSSLELMPFYLKKVMRRGTDYVEDSFETSCKDSKIIIKPLMITRKRVSRIIRKAIRNTAKKHLEGKIKLKDTKEIFSDVMTNKMQKELSLKVKKTYPLALCEIRILKVIGKPDKAEKTKESDEKKEEK